MKNERPGRKRTRFHRLAQIAIVGVALVLVGETPSRLAANVQAQVPGSQGRSRAENVQKLTGKKLRLDRAGRPRAISEQEARETVLQLEAVLAGRRPSAPARGSGAMTMVELGGAANRTVVARPREDGSFATLCVTTVDEAVDFLSGDRTRSSEDR